MIFEKLRRRFWLSFPFFAAAAFYFVKRRWSRPVEHKQQQQQHQKDETQPQVEGEVEGEVHGKVEGEVALTLESLTSGEIGSETNDDHKLTESSSDEDALSQHHHQQQPLTLDGDGVLDGGASETWDSPPSLEALEAEMAEAKQRVSDWAEEHAFGAEMDDQLEEMEASRRRDGGRELTRCGSSSSWSESSSGHWPPLPRPRWHGVSPVQRPRWNEESPRHRKMKRIQRDSWREEEEEEGEEKSPDPDNWRLHMNQYRPPTASPFPSTSPCNDLSSVVSGDSGRGSSEAAAFAAAAAADGSIVVYEFEFPSQLCGRLIGKNGRNLKQLMEETRTMATIRKQPFRDEVQIVSVVGNQDDVQDLLRLVRERFPKHRNSEVNLSPVNVPLPQESFLPSFDFVRLDEQNPNAVVVSAIESSCHVFLQLPSHPTFPDLQRLDACMLACYNQAQAPLLPSPVNDSVVCAAPYHGGWYRAQLVRTLSPPSRTEEADNAAAAPIAACVRYLDYGGFDVLPLVSLRSIRSDFLALPFQAVECFLAGVRPARAGQASETTTTTTTTTKSAEDNQRDALVLEGLIRNKRIEAIVEGLEEDATPRVRLFARSASGGDLVDVNAALVEAGIVEAMEALADLHVDAADDADETVDKAAAEAASAAAAEEAKITLAGHIVSVSETMEEGAAFVRALS